MSDLTIYPTVLLILFAAIILVLSFLLYEKSWDLHYEEQYHQETRDKEYRNLRNCLMDLATMPSHAIPESLFDEDLDLDDEDTPVLGG